MLEEVPGFVELFEAGTASADVAFGIEAEAGAFGEGVGGDYVPEVEREDVGDEDVDVGGGVVAFFLLVGVGGLDLVSVGVEGFGAFDLDAPGARAGVEDEVVALAVAPGLGDGVSESGGFEDEGGFGALSGALGVRMLALFGSGVGLGVNRFYC